MSSVCMFCFRNSAKEEEYGKLYTYRNITAHLYCLLFSSNLSQNGSEDQGIIGFLLKDIKKELTRGFRLRCCFCHKKFATVGCTKSSCRKSYHFPCGLENGASFLFMDDYSTFCRDHRTYQNGEKIGEKVECPICLEEMIADPVNCIWPPCCSKQWFHSICLKKLALSAGYFFKCPLCNDNKIFVRAMQQNGVYIPETDASWELEPNAFNELLERPFQCTAEICKCKNGRKEDVVGTYFEVMLCSVCGSVGTHLGCADLELNCKIWQCKDCLEMIEKKNLQKFFETMSLCQNSKDTLISPIRGNICKVEGDCFITPPKSEAGSINVFSPAKEILSFPGPSKLLPFEFSPRNNSDSPLNASLNFSLKVLKSLSESLKEINVSSEIVEMKEFISKLPQKMCSLKIDDFTLLYYTNMFINNIEKCFYQINLEHISNFLLLKYSYEQSKYLRKIIETVLNIIVLKKRIKEKHQIMKQNLFSGVSTKNDKELLSNLENSLVKLVFKAAKFNLLEVLPPDADSLSVVRNLTDDFERQPVKNGKESKDCCKKFEKGARAKKVVGNARKSVLSSELKRRGKPKSKNKENDLKLKEKNYFFKLSTSKIPFQNVTNSSTKKKSSSCQNLFKTFHIEGNNLVHTKVLLCRLSNKELERHKIIQAPPAKKIHLNKIESNIGPYIDFDSILKSPQKKIGRKKKTPRKESKSKNTPGQSKITSFFKLK